MRPARDARDAEQMARQEALRHFNDAKNLAAYAPPPASDPLAHKHNMQLARAHDVIGHGFMQLAAANDEYAVGLEQQRDVA